MREWDRAHYQVLFWVLIDLIVEYLGLIIKPFDNQTEMIGNAIDSGMGLSITIDKFRVFINKTLSILSAYQ
jgi:hypothetical protein